ncbi:MAG: signal peptidase II [Candidatus Omnitrophica bacterium]|nr:signal peptidase II [Candidatus Omnitrophota bacterium]
MIFIIVAAIIAFDQLAKYIAAQSLSLNQPICVIKGIFSLTLVHNRGAAFGILKNQVPLFIVTSVVAVLLIYSELKSNRHRKAYSIGLSLILAGALGNLIDRVFFGYVIDFLDFHFWPVFNVADSAITVGALILGWTLIFKEGNNVS